MIYTIGFIEYYNEAIEMHKNNPNLPEYPQKLGKVHEDHWGGIVFKTVDDANEYIRQTYNNSTNWAVYELDADWDTDVHYNPHRHTYHLLRNASILRQCT